MDRLTDATQNVLYFTNYIKVVENLDHYQDMLLYPNLWQIDKDLKCSNNELIYSKDTLSIIPSMENLEIENKAKRIQISQIDIFTGAEIAKYNSITDAGKITGVHIGNIARCVRGEGKTAGGYIWRKC